MGWLNDITSSWRLNRSATLYGLLGLVFGFLLGLVIREAFLSWQNYYQLIELQTGVQPHWLKDLILAPAFGEVTQLSPALGLLAGSFAMMLLFYRHKIKPAIQAIAQLSDSQADWTTPNSDELVQAYQALKQSFQANQREKVELVAESNRLQRQVDSVLHNLKNPLATMQGDLELYAMMTNPVDQQPIIERMNQSHKRLTSYLARLDRVRQLEHVVPTMETICLSDLETIIAGELQAITTCTVVFQASQSEVAVQLDKSLFIEALEQIINNAIRYAKQTIVVTCRVESNQVVITIKDDGPGFTEAAKQFFSRCYFTENPGVSNAGLGLYTASQLLIKQGCDLQVRNQSGAAVEIIIPS